MKMKLKHLLAAAIPFWLIQLILLLSGYTDGRVIAQMYLPMFVVTAALLLTGQFLAGHGLWFFASAGLLTEWIMGLTNTDGCTNTGGIVANIAILLVGTVVSVLLQLALNTRKKRRAAQSK